MSSGERRDAARRLGARPRPRMDPRPLAFARETRTPRRRERRGGGRAAGRAAAGMGGGAAVRGEARGGARGGERGGRGGHGDDASAERGRAENREGGEGEPRTRGGGDGGGRGGAREDHARGGRAEDARERRGRQAHRLREGEHGARGYATRTLEPEPIGYPLSEKDRCWKICATPEFRFVRAAAARVARPRSTTGSDTASRARPWTQTRASRRRPLASRCASCRRRPSRRSRARRVARALSPPQSIDEPWRVDDVSSLPGAVARPDRTSRRAPPP